MSAAPDPTPVGEPIAVVIDGVRAVMWTAADGTPRAARDMCPHRRAPLSAGSVVDGELHCAYHGWTYDGTGRCTLVPALGPEGRVPPTACLTMLPVPDDPIAAPPIQEVTPIPAPAGWLDGDTAGLAHFWHPVARVDELDPTGLLVELLGEWWSIDVAPDSLSAESESGQQAWGVQFHLDRVWLAPLEPVAPLPEVPEWDEPGWRRRACTPAEGRFGAGLLLDNQLDSAHFAFLHAATFGTPAAARAQPADVLRSGAAVRSTMRVPITAANDFRADAAERPEQQYRTMHYQFEAPLWLRLRLDYEDMGGSTVILFSITPLSAGRARIEADLLFAHPDGFTDEQLDARVAFENRVVGEDLALQRRFEDLRLPLDPTEEVHTKVDRLSLQCRQVLRELLAGVADES